MKKALYVFVKKTKNMKPLGRFSESSSKSVSSCHKAISTLSPKMEVKWYQTAEMQNMAELSATAAQILQHRKLPRDKHSSSTISQQNHCHCKEINNDYSVGIPFLIMQSFLVH